MKTYFVIVVWWRESYQTIEHHFSTRDEAEAQYGLFRDHPDCIRTWLEQRTVLAERPVRNYDV